MANKLPVEIDGVTGSVRPNPRNAGRYRCKLDTIYDVKREMSRVYREARSGLIETVEGSKLIYMLGQVGRVIEGSELEKRVEALESNVKE